MKRTGEQASKQVDSSFIPSDRYFSAFWVVISAIYVVLFILGKCLLDFYQLYTFNFYWSLAQQFSCITTVKLLDDMFLVPWAIPEKKQTGRVEDILFWTPPGNFKVVTLHLEISEKKSFHFWKFSKILWHPLQIPRSKAKTQAQDPWKSTWYAWFFFEHPSWKFRFLF